MEGRGLQRCAVEGEPKNLQGRRWGAQESN